jgi:hypothetical protein
MLIGKKQDKLGRCRQRKVSDYAPDPVQAYAIDLLVRLLVFQLFSLITKLGT